MSSGSKKYGLRSCLVALWVLGGNSHGTDAHLLSWVPLTSQLKASCTPCCISILSDPQSWGLFIVGHSRC